MTPSSSPSEDRAHSDDRDLLSACGHHALSAADPARVERIAGELATGFAYMIGVTRAVSVFGSARATGDSPEYALARSVAASSTPMFNQHAKWLKVSREIEWRRPIASLNYLLTSHVWRQDNNGFSHQDPGFIDHVVNKKADVIRVYLSPEANTLLSVVDHCLRSRDYVNVVVAGKQPTWN